MKVRIRFAKTGALVYIGHLDVMRYFQKMFRRAGIPIAYSEGFSPHQILSFSHPLPLGMESEGEYADIELTESISSEEAIERLKAQSVPEIEILSFKELPQNAENAMASVKAAKYIVSFGDKSPFLNLSNTVDNILKHDKLPVIKVTKKGSKEVDIRPLIYVCEAVEDNKLILLVSSGSTDNLKPELVINAAAQLEGVEIDESDLVIRRLDQYTYIDGVLVSLDEVGSAIV